VCLIIVYEHKATMLDHWVLEDYSD